MRSSTLFVAAVVLVSSLVRQADAHHGSAPHFDPDDLVTLDGVVKELKLVNPHSWLHFEVEGADGSLVEWRCELGGATLLGRLGWSSETLIDNEPIRITGARARREDNACAARSIILADGTDIANGEPLDGGSRSELVASTAEADARPRYLDNGQPNLSGGWILRTGGGMGAPSPEPTEAGRLAAENYDGRFDNPVIRCESGNIILDWTRQSHVNGIVQEGDRVVIHYGYHDLTRTIHLGMDDHPANLAPSIAGHSIGRWDGDTLVVDTAGFMERVLIPRADLMTSPQMHVEERFWYDEDTRALFRDFVVTDPYLSEPYRDRNLMDVAAVPHQSFDCVDLSGENNRRPD
jgi:hypothetical protein